MENSWQASTGSISRGKDKFLIGPCYTDDSLLVDLITLRYGGLYKPPSTARILITFCLKPAKFFLRERERDRRADPSVEDTRYPSPPTNDVNPKKLHECTNIRGRCKLRANLQRAFFLYYVKNREEGRFKLKRLSVSICLYQV